MSDTKRDIKNVNEKNANMKIDTIEKFEKNVNEKDTDMKMDEKNKEAINILFTKGEKAFIEKVFTGDNGERLSYAEMRSRYG